MKVCKKMLSLFLILQVLLGGLPLLSAMDIQEIVSAEETSTDENAEDISSEKIRPKVSVIVPVYNTEPYLRECLDSIKNQTLREIEIICVDDGSTDNSGKILDEYAANDSRFIVIHKENQGPALARQVGLDFAKGEYVKFVDSDDYIDLQTLEICYNEAKKDDVDVLVHGAYAFTFNNKKLRKCIITENRLIDNLNSNIFDICEDLALWNKLYKTNLIKKNNFNFGGLKGVFTDWCFNMMCFPVVKKVKLISYICYFYRSNPTSIVHSTSPSRTADAHIHNIKAIYNYWCDHGYFAYNNANYNFLRFAVSALNYNASASEFYKVFRDTLNELNPEFLIDKNLMNRLPQKERNTLQKIICSDNKSNVKRLPFKSSKLRRKVVA